MLNKLIRYEWKAVSGMNVLLAAISAGVCLLGMLYLQTPMWKELVSGGSSPYGYAGFTKIFGVLAGMGAMFIYVVMLSGVMFAQMIYFGVRYYGSMFSDQGYLTHTLPVKPEELLISKVFTAGGWTLLLNLLLIVLSCILIIAGVCGAVDATFTEVWEELGEVFRDIFLDDRYGQVNSEAVFKLLLWILLAVLNPFFNTAILFGALTLGHYSRKNKGLMGILAYIGVLFVRIMLRNVVSFILNLSTAKSWGRYEGLVQNNLSYYSGYLVNILLAVGLMIWTYHILKKHLNLE